MWELEGSKSFSDLKPMMRVAAEVNCVVNEMRRTGGFSPAQWVLGRGPRYSAGEHEDEEQAGQIGSMQERIDPTTIFAERMAYRHEACRGCAKVTTA